MASLTVAAMPGSRSLPDIATGIATGIAAEERSRMPTAGKAAVEARRPL